MTAGERCIVLARVVPATPASNRTVVMGGPMDRFGVAPGTHRRLRLRVASGRR
jgi:hypothetical protein